MNILCFYFLVSKLFYILVFCDEHSHTYASGEEVIVWINTVGPYENRQERYPYYSLPFCRGHKLGVSHHHETLGELLLGYELQFSGLDIKYGEEQQTTPYCSIEVSDEARLLLSYAIRHNFWYEAYVDDLPMHGYVGQLGNSVNASDVFLYTHKIFLFEFNADRIIQAKLVNEKPTRLSENRNISFTYEVQWRHTNVSFDDRFDVYEDSAFFEHKIHWFSIFNSFIMVIFLVIFVLVILSRTLSRDYARYSSDEEAEILLEDVYECEYGWKQIHADVFRPLATDLQATLLATLVGAGWHLTLVVVFIGVLAVCDDLYTRRGAVLGSALFIFTATCPINGYFGGATYIRLNGTRWIRQMLCSAIFIPFLLLLTSGFVSLVAMFYHSAYFFSFFVFLSIVCIWSFVVLPLTFFGALLGRKLNMYSDFPCRVNNIPRPLPEKKWYLRRPVIVLTSGLLPFGSISIEMYFILTSFWAYRLYYVYGFMTLVFLILLFVCACVAIVSAYFLLNSEDYRWQWTSFLSGGSVSIYVFIYSIYYFYFKTKMYGLFQTVFYFSSMTLFSVMVGIICGTVSHASVSRFVRKIYSNVKID